MKAGNLNFRWRKALLILIITAPLYSLAQSRSDSLTMFRIRIDSLDASLLRLLGERMRITDDVGRYKVRHGMSAMQPERYRQIVDRMIEQGNKEGLREAFIRRYLEALHEESVKRQVELGAGQGQAH